MTEKNKYSLWIVPQGDVGEALQNLGVRLAEQQDSPKFVPHMTLVANIIANQHELEKVQENIATLAHQIGSFSVSLTQYSYMNEEFRCLYLLAEQTPELDAVYQAAAKLFPQVNDEHFRAMPHLSVMYGNLPETIKQKLIAQHPFEPTTFTVDSFDLYLTNDPVSSWQLESSTPLSS